MCEAKPLKGGEFCYWHSPGLKGARLQASKQGGLNRRLQEVYGETVQFTTPRDAERFLAQVINAVWTGKMPVQAGMPGFGPGMSVLETEVMPFHYIPIMLNFTINLT